MRTEPHGTQSPRLAGTESVYCAGQWNQHGKPRKYFTLEIFFKKVFVYIYIRYNSALDKMRFQYYVCYSFFDKSVNKP
jgi:hypothetical protein